MHPPRTSRPSFAELLLCQPKVFQLLQSWITYLVFDIFADWIAASIRFARGSAGHKLEGRSLASVLGIKSEDPVVITTIAVETDDARTLAAAGKELGIRKGIVEVFVHEERLRLLVVHVPEDCSFPQVTSMLAKQGMRCTLISSVKEGPLSNQGSPTIQVQAWGPPDAIARAKLAGNWKTCLLSTKRKKRSSSVVYVYDVSRIGAFSSEGLLDELTREDADALRGDMHREGLYDDRVPGYASRCNADGEEGSNGSIITVPSEVAAGTVAMEDDGVGSKRERKRIHQRDKRREKRAAAARAKALMI